MTIHLISADHRRLDLETVSRLAAVAPGLGRDLLADLPRLRGVLVLATCNRVALLLDSPDPEGPVAPAGPGPEPEGPGPEPDGSPAGRRGGGLVEEVTSILARRAGLAEDDVAPAAWAGAQAYRELFSTASGLESMVVGERQIAGQVRRAMRAAEQEGTLSPGLVRVLEHALVVSRRVAAETGVAGRGRSLAAVGVDIVARRLPPLDRCRVVLVGTGSYAGATVAVLRDRGATDISVYSASHRAQAFARDHGLSAVAPGGLAEALTQADLVVTCRGLGAAVLTRDLVERAGARRAGGDGTARPLAVLDLSLARDVEPEVGQVPGVVYRDMRGIQAEVPDADAQDLAAARAVVAQEAEAFERFLDGRRMDGLIRGIRSQVGDVVAQEAARLRPVGAGRSAGGGGGGRAAGDGGTSRGSRDTAGPGAQPGAGPGSGPEAGSGAVPGAGPGSTPGAGPGAEPVVTLADAQQALRRLAARLLHHPTVAARRAGEEGQEKAFLAALETVLGPEVAAGAAEAAGLPGPAGTQAGGEAHLGEGPGQGGAAEVSGPHPPAAAGGRPEREPGQDPERDPEREPGQDPERDPGQDEGPRAASVVGAPGLPQVRPLGDEVPGCHGPGGHGGQGPGHQEPGCQGAEALAGQERPVVAQPAGSRHGGTPGRREPVPAAGR